MATELTDREYQALAGFRYALRVFLRLSEQQARAAGQRAGGAVARDQHVARVAHHRGAEEVVGLAREAHRDRPGHRDRADERAQVGLVGGGGEAHLEALVHRVPNRIPCFLKASRRKSGL